MKFSKIFLFTILAVFSFGFISNQVHAAEVTGTTSLIVGSTPLPTSPVGTLVGFDCQIPLDSSFCNTTLTLDITNPTSGAATNITKNVPINNTEVANGITPTAKADIAVDYGGTTFYLNHDGNTLASTTVGATCATGSWDGSKCSSAPVPVCPTVIQPAGFCLNGTLSQIMDSNNCVVAFTCVIGGGGTTTCPSGSGQIYNAASNKCIPSSCPVADTNTANTCESLGCSTFSACPTGQYLSADGTKCLDGLKKINVIEN